MRKAEKERNKILVPNSVLTRLGLENSKKKIAKKLKKKKTSFRHYLYPKWDEKGRERAKKILVPNSVPTRPRQENSKKNIKIIQNIQKHHSCIISKETKIR